MISSKVLSKKSLAIENLLSKIEKTSVFNLNNNLWYQGFVFFRLGVYLSLPNLFDENELPGIKQFIFEKNYFQYLFATIKFCGDEKTSTTCLDRYFLCSVCKL